MSKPEPAPSSVGPLEARIVASVRWVAVGQVVTQLGRFAVSVVLARLLAPSEFGLMAMAAVLITLASLFPTLGTGQAIVQRKELTEGLLRTLATLGLLTGFALSVLLALGAWSAATLVFEEPRVGGIVAVLGLQFAIHSFSVVPESLLQREMRLDRLVWIDLAQLIVSSSVAVGLAAKGWSVWALVASGLAGAAARTLTVLWASPWRLRFGFEPGTLSGLATFGFGVVGVSLVTYVSRFADRVLIGRLLGATTLGFYDYACRLFWYPMEMVAPVLVSVMFPALAKVQDDNARLGRGLLRATGLVVLVAAPVMIGLAAVADPFVPILLGERWRPVVPLIVILAPAGILAAAGVTTGEVLMAKGRVMQRFWLTVVNTSILLAAILIGVSGGIHSVAISIAIARIPVVLVSFAVVLRLVGLSLNDLWRTVRSTVMLSVIMGAAVTLLRTALLRTSFPPVLVLLACIAFGALIYLGGTRLHSPPALRDFYLLLPPFLQRRPLVVWLFEPVRRPA